MLKPKTVYRYNCKVQSTLVEMFNMLYNLLTNVYDLKSTTYHFNIHSFTNNTDHLISCDKEKIWKIIDSVFLSKASGLWTFIITVLGKKQRHYDVAVHLSLFINQE